jgi:hypothetical protein
VLLNKSLLGVERCATGKDPAHAEGKVNAEGYSVSSMIRYSLFSKASHHHSNPVTNVGHFLKMQPIVLFFLKTNYF